MTPPARVERQPRSACVAPYDDVRGCVRETLAAEGMAWAAGAWDCIITHESGWNRWATGRAGERGLTQVHPVWFGTFDASRLYDPDYNVRAAVTIWRAAGGSWRPWSTARGCGLR